MLLTQTLDIKVNQGNVGFLRKHYPHVNIGTTITIPSLMFKGSTLFVEVQCDYCEDIIDVQIKNYIISTEKYHKYSCKNPKCQTAKRKELEDLGINNFKKKRAETCLKKYGVDNPRKAESVKQKIKNTTKGRYGVEHIFQSKEHRKKYEKTMIKKYGVTHINHSEEFRRNKFAVGKDPNYIEYNAETKLNKLKCDKGFEHEYEIDTKNYISRNNYKIPLCTVCNPIGSSSSIKQEEVLEYIKSLTDLEVINNYRDGLEIDIYIPELKLGFEFNGLYWHSEEYKEPNYHAEKNKYFAEKGIRIIHIWEDEWDFKRDIICSQIQNLLGLSKKVYARNTKIQRIKNKDAREFLEEHHLQGGYRGIQISYGLFHEDELISVMTFDSQEGRKQMPEDEYNLSRFCSKKGTAVIGGASKLLTAFCREQKPNRIISYADADWSNGGVYETLGFEKISHSRPDYKYVVDGVREHKSKYRKPKGEQRTEREIMEELGIPRVYDSGKIKYELKTQTTQNGKKNKKGR